MNDAPRLLIVTGLSGAGISTALKDLEDFGYEVFDNLPPALIAPLMSDAAEAGAMRPVAVSIDVRARSFSADAVLRLKAEHAARLLFITADEAVLHRRFTETRRRHPLAQDRPVAAGIKREQELLHSLRAAADLVIDTSDYSVHDFKRALGQHFRPADKPGLTVTLMSFGFRFGLPREADMVFDIRFLKNPHWVDELRPLTGREAAVGAYIASDPHFTPFIDNLKNLLGPLLPLYSREGKTYLTVAIGCTGGKHRSVFVVETLKDWLAKQPVEMLVHHRDVER